MLGITQKDIEKLPRCLTIAYGYTSEKYDWDALAKFRREHPGVCGAGWK